MIDAILEIIVLEIIVHSNGRCTLGNNNACSDMTHV
jgi:hypothetical protein